MKKQLLNVKKKLVSGAIFSLLLSGSFFQDATAQTTVQVGTGTRTSNIGAIASCYSYSYIQQIYTATEMINAGSSQGGLISKVRFYFSSATGGPIILKIGQFTWETQLKLHLTLILIG